MRAILRTPADPEAIARLSKNPRYNSTLRTTCVATMLAGGHAYNALPQSAEAVLIAGSSPRAIHRRTLSAPTR